MSAEFEKLVMQRLDMSAEFEKLVMKRLDMSAEFEKSVTKRLDMSAEFEKSVMKKLDAVETRLNTIETRLDSIEQKLDITTNVNIANILINQTNNHEELLRKISEYERTNNLEHSRLNYEICKLAANA